MKSIEEFREFYERQLRPALGGLEQRRKRLSVTVWYVVGGVCAVGAIMGLLLRDIVMEVPIAGFGIVIGTVILGGGIWKLMRRSYVAEFKKIVIGRTVRFIGEDLQYDPRGYIDKATFISSKIFTTRPDHYRGDDLVWGKVGQTEVRFSEIRVEEERGTGKNRHRHTIFHGLFFVGQFNKEFKGWTVVLPDTAERLFGRLGQKLQELNIFRGKLIKLEDPEFERQFVVYGNDQVEARYILSTSLMERITAFRQKVGRALYLSFVGSKVYVAIPYMQSLFEPKTFGTLLEFENVKEYFEDLALAVGIVEDLNLNLRIWSKV